MKQGKMITTFTSKKGNAIEVRSPHVDDIDTLVNFVNALSAEDTFVELSGEVMTKKDEMEYLSDNIKKISSDTKIQLFAWIGDVLIANFEIQRGKGRQQHVGHISLSVAKEYREEGIGTKLLETLISHARVLGLRLLTLDCYENNDRALHVYEKIGFKKAGIIPGAIAFQGTFVGEVKMYRPQSKLIE